MILRDYHMHTTWCDGSASAEEMVKAAVDQGLDEVGISGHSYTFFDESYCMTEEDTLAYREELGRLREEYADRISLKVGIEQDCWSEADTGEYDYVIGSVHYVRIPAPGKKEGEEMGEGEEIPEGVLSFGDWLYLPVDETAKLQQAIAGRFFGGDMIAFAERYFADAARVCEETKCDLIGHFDLITKFNEGGALFDEEDPRYVAAWKKAADRLLEANVPFEINTGAMSKGYRSRPYPSDNIRSYLRERGARFILSSDSHRTDTLCFAFDRYEEEVDPLDHPGR